MKQIKQHQNESMEWVKKSEMLKELIWGQQLRARHIDYRSLLPKRSISKPKNSRSVTNFPENPSSTVIVPPLSIQLPIEEPAELLVNQDLQPVEKLLFPTIQVKSPHATTKFQKTYTQGVSFNDHPKTFITEKGSIIENSDSNIDSEIEQKKRNLSPNMSPSRKLMSKSNAAYITVNNGGNFSSTMGKFDIQRKRIQTFKVDEAWEKGIIEGMYLTKYNKKTMSDKTIQEYILTDKLRTVVDKAFQLRVILERGVKVFFSCFNVKMYR